MKRAGISVGIIGAILFTVFAFNKAERISAGSLGEWQVHKAYLNERNVRTDFRHFSLRFPGSSLCMANLDFTLHGNHYEMHAFSAYTSESDTVRFYSDRTQLDFKFVRSGDKLILNDPQQGLYLELRQ